MPSNFKRHVENPEFYQGEDILFNITFYDDRFQTVAIDPGTQTLLIEEPDGTNVVVTLTQDGARPANLGKYRGTFSTTKAGLHSYEWRTTTPKIVKPGKFNVIPTEII